MLRREPALDFAEFYARCNAAMRAFKNGGASDNFAPRNVFNVSRAPLPLEIRARRAACGGRRVSRFVRELREAADSVRPQPPRPDVSRRDKKC